MTKTQIKVLSDVINQTKTNEKAINMFNVINGNAYFTPDGIVGYKIPMDILYQAEESHGITIPEASGSETIYNTIERVDNINCYNTGLNAKEFLVELKTFYKTAKTFTDDYTSIVYKILFKDRIHCYRLRKLIDAFTIIGNKADVYIKDNTYGNMYILSDECKAVILPVRLSTGEPNKAI